MWFMEDKHSEPEQPDVMTSAEPATPHIPATPHGSAPNPPTIRHDGWTGEKMAQFCEVLAETAVVAEACEEVGRHISGAYALRRRNPVFAAAWDAALTIARERLADTLLARAMEGNAELIYRDGEMVGRREVIDNRLGLAILGRLDRLAETGRATGARGERAATSVQSRRNRAAPSVVPGPFDWDLMLEALRTRDPDDIAGALAALKSYEVEEVEDPPNSPARGDADDDDDAGLDLSDRCWKDEVENVWMTDFPPPEGFAGYQNGEFGDPDLDGYERHCTPAEVAAIEGDLARAREAERAEDAALRDAWFDLLRADGPSAAC